MLRPLLILLLAGAMVFMAVIWLAGQRWRLGTRRLRGRLNAARLTMDPPSVDFRELEALPPPVQRYLRAVLREGMPMVKSVRVRHEGWFNMGETAERWRPFTSDQKIVTRRPGFDWDARIQMFPGAVVRVHDAYADGEGILQVALLGLVPLVDLRGSGAIAEGELMRFLAEAAWYPTALLPRQGMEWKPVDDRSARGTLTDGPIRSTMLFTFDQQGLLDTVSSDARGRLVRGEIVPTPWRGRFWNYDERGGMKIPLEGEVAWLLPRGPKPYWRGRIVQLTFELAGH